MLPTAGDRQDFYTICLFFDLARQFVHAYFGHFLALFETFSTFALESTPESDSNRPVTGKPLPVEKMGISGG
jgi:hypothetical protein